MSDAAAVFVTPIRVYYADTDAGGIVYHARYLEFAERARAEMLRAAGLPLVAASGHQFVIRRAGVEWIAPARLDDLLECRTSLISARGARLTLRQDICRDGQLLARIDAELAQITATGQPARLAPALIAALQSASG